MSINNGGRKMPQYEYSFFNTSIVSQHLLRFLASTVRRQQYPRGILVVAITLGRNTLRRHLRIASSMHLRLRLECSLLLLLLRGDQVAEPVVLEGVGRADTELRSELQHLLQQVDARRIDHGQDLTEVLGGVHLEVWLVLGELGDAGPCPLGRGAHDPEDARDLVLVGRAREQWPARVHLRHDAASGPDVYACVVCPASQQDVGSAIPQRDNLVGEGVDRDTKSSRQTEITKFQLSLAVDQEVLGFEIPMQDSVLVAEVDPLEELVHERLDEHWLEGSPVAFRVHVLLQIAVHVVEHQHELILCVDHIM